MALGGADNLARSPELRTKLLWTLGLLCAYRIGVHIPVPGVDGGALAHFFESVAGTLFGLFDMFSGGGLRNVSVFALGIKASASPWALKPCTAPAAFPSSSNRAGPSAS